MKGICLISNAVVCQLPIVLFAIAYFIFIIAVVYLKFIRRK
jgi:hypothetical protein